MDEILTGIVLIVYHKCCTTFYFMFSVGAQGRPWLTGSITMGSRLFSHPPVER